MIRETGKCFLLLGRAVFFTSMFNSTLSLTEQLALSTVLRSVSQSSARQPGAWCLQVILTRGGQPTRIWHGACSQVNVSMHYP